MTRCKYCGTRLADTDAAKAHRPHCIPPKMQDYQEIAHWYWVEKSKSIPIKKRKK